MIPPRSEWVYLSGSLSRRPTSTTLTAPAWVFGKTYFSSSESASVPQTTDFEEDVAVGLGDQLSPTFRKPASGNARIFFSCDRDIDLYELEELCNAVGWFLLSPA